MSEAACSSSIEDYGRHRWGLPGGRHEPGESVEETAIREAKEETNLDVELGELIGEYEIMSAVGAKQLEVSVFVAVIVGGDLKPNEGEIAEIDVVRSERPAASDDGRRSRERSRTGLAAIVACAAASSPGTDGIRCGSWTRRVSWTTWSLGPQMI